MTEQEILEGNKLLAKYMGTVLLTDGISWFDTEYEALKHYHNSWDNLIPVLYKIYGNSTLVLVHPGDRLKEFSRAVGMVKKKRGTKTQ